LSNLDNADNQKYANNMHVPNANPFDQKYAYSYKFRGCLLMRFTIISNWRAFIFH